MAIEAASRRFVAVSLLLAAAIISTWLRIGDLEAKQENILKALARIEDRLTRPVEQPKTVTCIKCLGKVTSQARSCPHCGTTLRYE